MRPIPVEARRWWAGWPTFSPGSLLLTRSTQREHITTASGESGWVPHVSVFETWGFRARSGFAFHAQESQALLRARPSAFHHPQLLPAPALAGNGPLAQYLCASSARSARGGRAFDFLSALRDGWYHLRLDSPARRRWFCGACPNLWRG
jgi:hypothetical protein